MQPVQFFDTKGIPFKVGSIIRFNTAESYYRDSTEFGKIVEISSKGKITFCEVPTISKSIENTPALSIDEVSPDLKADLSCARITFMDKKRGKKAKNGYYRYCGYDFHVYVVTDPGERHVSSNCY